jgi:hypothetical protein
MPFLRRRPKLKTTPPEGDPRTRARLLGGHDFPGIRDGPSLDADQLRAAWVALRESLMAEHIRKQPRSRPWGWWEYEAPESRRQVADGPEPVAGCPLWFGMPELHRGFPPGGMYESQDAYLTRLGLLLPGE